MALAIALISNAMTVTVPDRQRSPATMLLGALPAIRRVNNLHLAQATKVLA